MSAERPAHQPAQQSARSASAAWSCLAGNGEEEERAPHAHVLPGEVQERALLLSFSLLSFLFLSFFLSLVRNPPSQVNASQAISIKRKKDNSKMADNKETAT